jgi:hypothetical protein
MEKLELPIVGPNDSMADAYSAMRRENVCGVVVRHAHEYRLVHDDDLRRIIARSGRTVGQADSFIPLLVTPRAPDSQLQQQLDRTGARFLFLAELADRALLISSHESGARFFLSPPKYCQCTDPGTTHYYPPEPLTPGQSTCTYDSSPLVYSP